MRIVACLAWYREPLPFLERLVRSLAGHVDALVAVDGPWSGFDGDVTSPRAERDMLRVAAAEADVPTRIVTPRRTWKSQVEKRAEVFRLAIDEHAADWLLVVDGDVSIERCEDEALRKSLELTDRDVAEVLVREMNRSWPHSEFPVHNLPQRHLFRATPGLTFRNAHNGIVTLDGRWLNGDAAYVRREPSLDLTRVVEFSHDNQNRGADRNAAAKAYRKLRETESLESWR